jgi:hypothetical protein
MIYRKGYAVRNDFQFEGFLFIAVNQLVFLVHLWICLSLSRRYMNGGQESFDRHQLIDIAFLLILFPEKPVCACV